MTPNQIGAFQAHARDWAGQSLVIDQDLGPRTKWALAVADLPRFRRRIVDVACARVGTVEVPLGSNSGPEIDHWLQDARSMPGQPWCAAFVCMVLAQSGVQHIRTASARECLEQYVQVQAPDVGDLFGWVNADGTGHVGFVIGFTRGGVATCEGNSNDGVRNCERPWAGLQFRRVRGEVQPAELAYVTGLPLVQRATQGTR